MKGERLSVNRALYVFLLLVLFFTLSLSVSLYLLTDNFYVVGLGLAYAILVCFSLFVLIGFLRNQLSSFSRTLCTQIDKLMRDEIELPKDIVEEDMLNKINHQLLRLCEMMRETKQRVAKERADLQELITDISHQVKTPIANLKMINSTLIQQAMSKEKQLEFLFASQTQLDKLDFLIQAMIKTSRIETGIITLQKKNQSIYDTLAISLGAILLSAEKKEISVSVDCKEDCALSHDRKWTSEALFNLLDNAVKYTPAGGRIDVKVQSWESVLKIDITDTGCGIEESHYPVIFKRFYREGKSQDMEGVGIGLTLAREIITLQGGTIQVTSQVNHGSTFSVFLPYE